MTTELLSAAKAELVVLMKKRDAVTAKEAAQELGLAVSTVRQHLSELERDRFVASRRQRQGVGRPRKLHFLTDKSDRFFINQDQLLLSKLVGSLLQGGAEEQLEKFFDLFGREWISSWRRHLIGLTARQRVEALELLLEKRGYVPELRYDGEERIRVDLFHCPYSTVLEHVDAPCRLEEKLLAHLVGGSVEKTCHMFDEGCDSCSFLVGFDEDNAHEQN